MVSNCGDVAVKNRADGRGRTGDLVLTMDALYQLSYVGLKLASYRRRTGGGPEEQTDSARRG